MDGHNPPGPVALGMENARLRAELAGLRKVVRSIEHAANLPVPAPNAWDDYNRAARVRLYEIRILLHSIGAVRSMTIAELAAAAAAFDKLAKSDRLYLTAEDAYKAMATPPGDGAAEIADLRAAAADTAEREIAAAARADLRAAGIPLVDEGEPTS